MLGLMSVLVAAEAEVAVTTGAYLDFLPSVVYLEKVTIRVSKVLPPRTTPHDADNPAPSCSLPLNCALQEQMRTLDERIRDLIADVHSPTVAAPHRFKHGFFSAIVDVAGFLKPAVEKVIKFFSDSDVAPQLTAQLVEPVHEVPVNAPPPPPSMSRLAIQKLRKLVKDNAVDPIRQQFYMSKPNPDGERQFAVHSAIADLAHTFDVYLQWVAVKEAMTICTRICHTK